MTKLLLIEDNLDLAFGLKMNLEIEGYHVTAVDRGADGITQICSGLFALAILDLILPDVSGFDIIRTARTTSVSIPIMVLSARSDEVDRVTALRLGAVDYVTKPFSLLELLERIKLRLPAVMPRSAEDSRLIIDVRRQSVIYCQRPIRLTGLEFDLLCELARAQGAVLSK